MAQLNDAQRAYKLLTVLQSYAPSFGALEKCDEVFNAAPNAGTRVKMLTCAIADGLLYGNWPWIEFGGLKSVVGKETL